MAAPLHEGIIVLGTPRSGTTLLRRLLDAHPRIACPGETSVLNACARFLESARIAEGVEIGVLSGLAHAGFPEDEVLGRLRDFALAFPREHARREGKERWAEKTAFDSFYVDAIERLFADHAYFVCVIRHGLDVACSIQELCEKNGGYLPELHEYVKLHPRPLEAFAHAWVDLTTAIRGFAERHAANVITVRYEDLVENPDAALGRVLEFVGEPADPGLAARAMGSTENVGLGDWKTYGTNRIGSGSVGRHRELSSATIASLGAIVNDTLVACGYDAVEVGPERTSDEARRRYELGLMLQAARRASDESP